LMRRYIAFFQAPVRRQKPEARNWKLGVKS
jgi:hypothetical protein